VKRFSLSRDGSSPPSRQTFRALTAAEWVLRAAQVSLGMSELLVEFLLITLAFGWTLIDRQGGNATQDPILGRLGLALSTGSAWATRLTFIGVVAAVQVHCLSHLLRSSFDP
jgi:hypothetical protein